MGLDSVELLMEVEKAFGIQIPDEEAEKIYTVGDFYEVVWNKVQQKSDDACYTQMLFYNLRVALVELFGADRSSINTSSDLNGLIPDENRRALYQQLSLQTELRLPTLALIAPWSSIMYVVSILFGIAPIIVVFIGWFFFSLPAQYFLVVLIGWVLLYSFSKLLNPFRQLVSPSNMRSFIEETLQLNHASFVNKNGISRANMETMIRMIIVDKIGVDMVEVIPSAKIHDDLGVD